MKRFRDRSAFFFRALMLVALLGLAGCKTDLGGPEYTENNGGDGTSIQGLIAYRYRYKNGKLRAILYRRNKANGARGFSIATTFDYYVVEFDESGSAGKPTSLSINALSAFNPGRELILVNRAGQPFEEKRHLGDDVPLAESDGAVTHLCLIEPEVLGPGDPSYILSYLADDPDSDGRVGGVEAEFQDGLANTGGENPATKSGPISMTVSEFTITHSGGDTVRLEFDPDALSCGVVGSIDLNGTDVLVDFVGDTVLEI